MSKWEWLTVDETDLNTKKNSIKKKFFQTLKKTYDFFYIQTPNKARVTCYTSNTMTYAVDIIAKTRFANTPSVFQAQVSVSDGTVVICLPVSILTIISTLSFATSRALFLDVSSICHFDQILSQLLFLRSNCSSALKMIIN